MITEKFFAQCAQSLGCAVWNLRAVQKVETNGSGFYPGTNKLVIKFEGHVFHQYTHGQYDQSHPHLSYPALTDAYSEYGPIGAYKRFNEAFALNKRAAMLATSFGAFQIMGENYVECGFKTVDDFVTSLQQSDANHLTAFCKLVIAKRIGKYLADLTLPTNAAGFAYRWNGSLYKRNAYDTNLMKAAAYFKKLYN